MSETNSLAVITDADLPSNFTNDLDADKLILRRPPAHVLEEARIAAVALKDVIEKKQKKVVFNGETYLEFEDLQTLGRFYGVTAKVVSTEFADFGGGAQGFVARAEALRSDGQVISAAEAMCLSDEPNWAHKPLFQLRSMAQTRACAKALRNVLAWVVVLAGYRPTPAEEMDGVRHEAAPATRREAAKPAAQTQAAVAHDGQTISEPQAKRLFAVARAAGFDNEAIKGFLLAEYGVEHTRDVKRSDYDEICAHFGASNERR